MGCSRCVCSTTCDRPHPRVSAAVLLQADEIVELCDNAERLFKQEKSVLELRVRVLEAAMMQGLASSREPSWHQHKLSSGSKCSMPHGVPQVAAATACSHTVCVC